jgi:hypothetical protein
MRECDRIVGLVPLRPSRPAPKEDPAYVPTRWIGEPSEAGARAPSVVEVMARAAYGRAPVGVRSWDDAPALTRIDIIGGMVAAIAALEASGFAVVPVEPTHHMVDVGDNETTADEVWRAMVGARPR